MTLPPFEDQIPTGDDLPLSFVYYRFRLPNTLWFISAILGQLIALNEPSAWVKAGLITEAEAAEAATQVYESLTVWFPIGSIIPYASSLPATADILPCNGASYLRSDYPDLFAAIGTVWGAPDIAHFNVPELRGRALIGGGAGPGLTNRVPGTLLGEETHVLTTSELASHTHSEGTTLPIVVDVTVPTLPGAVGAAGTTGATGGDAAHNNMQPSGVIVWGIVAR